MIVCLDADCVIYFVEWNPQWSPRIIARLAVLRAAGHDIAVTDLARTEVLAGPMQKGNAAVIADFQSFFAAPDIRIQSLTTAVCERAAQLRAVSNFKLKIPDCLHLGAAIEHGCGLFLTHDAQLSQCTAINVEILS